jgi:hypothetical protein
MYEHPGSVKEDFNISSREIAIPAKKLFALINKIKAEEISFKEKDKVLTIKHGKSTNRLSCENITSNKDVLYNTTPVMNIFEEGVLDKFKKYSVYDRTHEDAENIIFNEDGIVCSNILNIVKMQTEIAGTFALRWDIVKHIADNKYQEYHYAKDSDLVYFTKENFILVAKSSKNTFEYSDFFYAVEEDMDLRYAIVPEQGADIDHIDSILINYKKLEQRILIEVQDESTMILTAMGDGDTEESKIEMSLVKYTAGEKESFKILADNFKSMYKDYYNFFVFDRMLYCSNIEEGVERIIAIENVC